LNYFIGQKIEHGPAYGMTCSERFLSDYVHGQGCVRQASPTPLCESGTGYVIGLRMAIVDNYKFRRGREHRSLDGPPEYEQGSATGRREECLVCTASLKPFRPYLVRKKDVQKYADITAS